MNFLGNSNEGIGKWKISMNLSNKMDSVENYYNNGVNKSFNHFFFVDEKIEEIKKLEEKLGKEKNKNLELKRKFEEMSEEFNETPTKKTQRLEKKIDELIREKIAYKKLAHEQSIALKSLINIFYLKKENRDILPSNPNIHTVEVFATPPKLHFPSSDTAEVTATSHDPHFPSSPLKKKASRRNLMPLFDQVSSASSEIQELSELASQKLNNSSVDFTSLLLFSTDVSSFEIQKSEENSTPECNRPTTTPLLAECYVFFSHKDFIQG